MGFVADGLNSGESSYLESKPDEPLDSLPETKSTIQRFLVTSISTPNNSSNIPPIIAGASQTAGFFLRRVRILGATSLLADGFDRVNIFEDNDALGASGTAEVSIAKGDIDESFSLPEKAVWPTSSSSLRGSADCPPSAGVIVVAIGTAVLAFASSPSMIARGRFLSAPTLLTHLAVKRCNTPANSSQFAYRSVGALRIILWQMAINSSGQLAH